MCRMTGFLIVGCLAAAILPSPGAAAPADEPPPFMEVSPGDFVESWGDGEGIEPIVDMYYNRVDGYLFYGGIRYGSRSRLHPRLAAMAGWPSSRSEQFYEITVEQPFWSQDGFSLGVSLYERTDWSREDAERITDVENNLLALFFREEFRDYFGRQGFTAFASYRATPELTFRFEYRDDEISSLDTNQSVWSAFRRGHDWAENPALSVGIGDAAREFEGEMKGFVGSFVYDDRDYLARTGWLARGFFEYYGGDVGGDYSFRKYVVDLARGFRITETQSLWFRGVWGIGSARKDFPSHKLFTLGGVGTLRARDFKEFAGKNLFFASAEYTVRIRPELHTIYFVDTGQVWTGTSGFESDDLKTDVGIGIRFEAPTVGALRIDVARPATTESADTVITVRLAYAP